ncbi:hypothetical protein FIBSPDRAFT_861432, partial [Athelia psychrophila]
MHKVMEFVVFLIGPVEGVRAASVILDYLLTKYDGVVTHGVRRCSNSDRSFSKKPLVGF